MYLWPAFALGVVAQVVQAVFLRELLMVFYGSEFSIGIVLASWMSWVAVGSRWVGRWAGGLESPMRALKALSLASLAVFPTVLLLVRGIRRLFPLLPGEFLSLPATVGAAMVVMAPACLLLGGQFVLLARLWREEVGQGLGSGVTGGAERMALHGNGFPPVRAWSEGGMQVSRLGSALANPVAGTTGTYVWEALGTTLGGLLFSLALVHFLDSFQTVVLVGALLPTVVLALPADRRAQGCGRLFGGRPRRVAVGLGALIFVTLALPASSALDRWAHRLHWRSLSPHQELEETRQSKYGLISVGRQGGQYAFFQSGHLVFSAGGAGEEDVELEEAEAAVLAHFAMVQHPRPRRVLLLGGGLRGVLREVARHPVEKIDYVELDRKLVDVAWPRLSQATRSALEDPRVRLIHADARRYLSRAPQGYDLVLVDLPDPATALLNRFYTVEFFIRLKELLTQEGILVIGIGSTADLRSRPLANRNATVFHTLRAVFPYVFAVPGGKAYFVASREAEHPSWDPAVLRERYRARSVEGRPFSEGYFFTLLEEAPLLRLNWVLRHHGRTTPSPLSPPPAPPLFPPSLPEQLGADDELSPLQERFFLNADLRPIAYYHTTVLWSALGGGEATGLLDFFLRVRLWWFLPLGGAGLVLLLLFRHLPPLARTRADARWGLTAAVITTGFSIMTLQVALLFSFQSVYGFVYEMVGLIVALFMGGLALGAAGAHRWSGRMESRKALAWVQLGVAGFATVMGLVLPLAAAGGSTAATFSFLSVLTFLGGALNGAGFPFALSCALRLGDPPERATGKVYGGELMGGCLGAILTGAVMAPVLGVAACCASAAIMNAAALLLVLGGRDSSWGEPAFGLRARKAGMVQ